MPSRCGRRRRMTGCAHRTASNGRAIGMAQLGGRSRLRLGRRSGCRLRHRSRSLRRPLLRSALLGRGLLRRFLRSLFRRFFAAFFADFLAAFFADFFEAFLADFFFAATTFFFLAFFPLLFFALAIEILLLPPIPIHRAFQVDRAVCARPFDQFGPGRAARAPPFGKYETNARRVNGTERLREVECIQRCALNGVFLVHPTVGQLTPG